MSREFLFGKFYDSLTDEYKRKMIEGKSTFEINKNNFILSIYDNEDTMRTSYNTLKRNIINVEKIKNKDLMDFNTSEQINLMKSIPTSSVSTKERLYHLIDNYLDWCVSQGYIPINNFKGLSKDELCKVSKKIASYKVISIEDLNYYCKKALSTSKVSAIDVIPLILSRYGIVGTGLSRILNLKWHDIDRERKVVRIIEDDNEILLPVDDLFLDWIDRAYKCKEFKGDVYIDEGYVIKKRLGYEFEFNDMYVYNRLILVFKYADMPRMSFKTLEFSRKVDFLLDLRKDGVLKSSDFKIITNLFHPNASAGTTNTLIRYYESLTHDKVTLVKDKVKRVDNDSENTVLKIKKSIGYLRE